MRIVLELFSGSCRWARAVGRLHYYVIAIDTRFDAERNDLLAPKLQRAVLGWIQAGLIEFTLCGFPCQSLSKARNRPGGAPALRSAAHVMGLPNLSPVDRAKVQRGNAGVLFAARVARACLASKIVCILENPWTSWAWQLPAMAALLALPQIRFTRSDFCQ